MWRATRPGGESPPLSGKSVHVRTQRETRRWWTSRDVNEGEGRESIRWLTARRRRWHRGENVWRVESLRAVEEMLEDRQTLTQLSPKAFWERRCTQVESSTRLYEVTPEFASVSSASSQFYAQISTLLKLRLNSTKMRQKLDSADAKKVNFQWPNLPFTCAQKSKMHRINRFLEISVYVWTRPQASATSTTKHSGVLMQKYNLSSIKTE